jgi:hypothetical protein
MKRWIRTILIAMGLFAWGLLLAEISVRVMDPQPLLPRYVTGTAWGVRGNIPGAVYRHKTPEVNVQYRINRQGLRADREYPLAPPPDACRIGLIGDSYFVGYEADSEDTIARRLEMELEKRGLRAEVLNFSVSGFGTAEMLRAWEGQMRAFGPDLVVMQWHVTDLDDNLRSGLYRVSDGRLQRGADTYLPSIALQDRLMRSRLYRAIADNSQLYAFVRERAAGAVKALLVAMQDAKRGHKDAPEAQATSVAREGAASEPSADSMLSGLLVREMMREVTADGASFLVVDIPERDTRERVRSVWDSLPADLVQDVPVYHAADALQPLLSPHSSVFFEKGHWHLVPVAVSAVSAALAGRVEPLLRGGRCAARIGQQAVGP